MCGNHLALAPLTNGQSEDDGVLGDDELRWLTRRAAGGFGLVETCAAHVAEDGKAFDGQLGVWSDRHLPGLTRLATAIAGHGALGALSALNLDQEDGVLATVPQGALQGARLHFEGLGRFAQAVDHAGQHIGLAAQPAHRPFAPFGAGLDPQLVVFAGINFKCNGWHDGRLLQE